VAPLDTLRGGVPPRGLSLAVFAVLAVVAWPAGASAAVVYGFGDAPGLFAQCTTGDAPCSGQITGYWNDPSFTALGSPGSAHRLTMIRLYVAYDAVATSNGRGGCTSSNPWRYAYTDQVGRRYPRQYAWEELYNGLTRAHADGLVPVVAISGYSNYTAVKSYAGSPAPGDPAEPDPTARAGRLAFECGVRGLVNALDDSLPAGERPHYWEAWNEPNGGCRYLNNDCTPSRCAQMDEAAPCSATGGADSSCGDRADSGAARAACLAVQMAAQIRPTRGHSSDTLLDGAFAWPSTGYLAPYYRLLRSQNALQPTWSVHDYGDPTASDALGSDQTWLLAGFDAALSSLGCAECQMWVTEAGAILPDTDSNYAGLSLPCGATLGECVNGNRAAQAAGADGFFDLARVGPLPVTHLFWYEFTGPISSDWDSGLLDAGGTPREPYCAWLGWGNCASGSPWAGLATPTALTVARSAPRSVTLSWPAARGASSYRLLENGTVIATGLAATTYTVAGNADQDGFAVEAVDAAGQVSPPALASPRRCAGSGSALAVAARSSLGDWLVGWSCEANAVAAELATSAGMVAAAQPPPA
jgi:hypothetical protein